MCQIFFLIIGAELSGLLKKFRIIRAKVQERKRRRRALAQSNKRTENERHMNKFDSTMALIKILI